VEVSATPVPVPQRTVVVGLGNPLLSDDGVGVLAARLLAERLAGAPVSVVESAWGGMRFLDLLAGFDRAIVIDAIQWRRGPAGTVYRLTPDEAVPTVRAVSFHDISLGTALALGGRLGIPLPAEIVFLAVEAGDILTVSEACSPEVAAALPEVVRQVEAQLAAWGDLPEVRCTRPGSPSTL
jgi:hydrogenase maturation protease